ncbi:MAG: type VI secretion system Vgr family protein, partial [Gammaproteobacteria bacterium]
MMVKNNALESSSDGDDEVGCRCTVVATKRGVTFRPLRRTPKAFVRGPQTAVVTGPDDEEIYTDPYGRVRVQFHWDRHAEPGKHSSCWIRVAQMAAGRGWGAISVPRIGQEVIVNFLEGDPDRPIVTGGVYNGINMPPYTLPGGKTRTTLKTNSSKDGKGGFNELRFEDKKGEEHIFMHAEKDRHVRVKNDQYTWVGNEAHEIVTGERFEQVKNQHLTVTGELREHVGGASLTVDGEQHTHVTSRYAMSVGGEVHIVAGSNIVLEATNNITLKVGDSVLTVTSGGVDVSGGTPAVGGAIEPELPTAPRSALGGTGGTAADPVPLKTAKQATFDQSSIEVLVKASKNGLAYCEECRKYLPEPDNGC